MIVTRKVKKLITSALTSSAYPNEKMMIGILGKRANRQPDLDRFHRDEKNAF
jgi:hypothetical protein